MPTKGQILTDPTNQNVYEYIETANDTRGERVVMKATINQKGRLVPNHMHVLQDETFEVLSGKLTVCKDGKIYAIGAGEKVVLSKNEPHNHYNSEDIPLTYIQTVTPALDFDYLVENLVGLATDGKSRNGNYGLVQELVTLKYLDSKTLLADIPVGIQKILMHTIAPLGRLFGYRAIYKKYSAIEK
jgi:quercetin dioxygenase-like cupin family protein